MLFCISVEPLFDHEKLDVYCLELQFVAWIADRCSVQRRRELFEQLDRASLSALLNTAEGNANEIRVRGESPPSSQSFP